MNVCGMRADSMHQIFQQQQCEAYSSIYGFHLATQHSQRNAIVFIGIPDALARMRKYEFE